MFGKECAKIEQNTRILFFLEFVLLFKIHFYSLVKFRHRVLSRLA
jgi:hypothetical protein